MDLKQFYYLKEVLRSKRTVYLDNNATTQPGNAVIKCMHTIMKYHYGNPSSLYSIARKIGLIIYTSCCFVNY
jgi:selenocysteine lyase/cysteine desulfurase